MGRRSKGLRSVASGYAERSRPLFFQFSREGRRGGITKRRVQSPSVVILDPCGDFLAGMGAASEQRLVEQLVTHPPVEAFDERVLGWLARSGLVPFYTGLAAIFEHRVRGQFGSVVTHDHAGLAVHGDQPLQCRSSLIGIRRARNRVKAVTE